MSGHSKWATTHRQKEANDAVRGKLFSKLSKAITIAVKTGGSDSPDSNLTLRIAIDRARNGNMPKDNIDRAIAKGRGGEALEQLSYEGFGPFGTSLVILVASDNRNRTGQEIKNVLERGGGKLTGLGSVSFNFEPKGLIVVNKKDSSENDILTLIDLGVTDVEEKDGEYFAYVETHDLFEMKSKVEAKGFSVSNFELIQKPKTYQKLTSDQMERFDGFMKNLESHDDVQRVFSNVASA